MTKVIAIANQKGGVAKTTTVVNLAFALQLKGKKVLVVDMDHQANTTLYFGLDPVELETQRKTVYFNLVEERPISETIVNGTVDLVPSSLVLAEAEGALLTDISGGTVLSDSIQEIKSNYDFILIDSGPSLGMLPINSLAAADYVLIPVKTDDMSLSGVPSLLKTVAKVRKKLNPTLQVLGVLPTLYDEEYAHERKALADLKTQADQAGVHIFEEVPDSPFYPRAYAIRIPAVVKYPTQKGVGNYVDLANHIISL